MPLRIQTHSKLSPTHLLRLSASSFVTLCSGANTTGKRDTVRRWHGEWPVCTFNHQSRRASHATMADTKPLRYADVGINLGDPVFRGKYHGKKAHEDDLDDVVQRALDVGCTKLMITGSNLKESRHAVELAEKYPGHCYATIGVHPCSTQDFDRHPGGPDNMIRDLRALAVEAKQKGHAVAFGEIGLDYDRLFLSPKDVQLKYFELQLDLAEELQLPLFLHSRAAGEDFERIMTARLDKLPKRGLVHSFTGTIPELDSLVNLGFDIGVNGCSMKTEENLEAVKAVPLDRLQIETDGPWCEIRPSHASSQYLTDGPAVPKAVKKEKWQKGLMVKGRNEPATIVQVAHVAAKVKGISVEELCEAAWKNSLGMFGLGESEQSGLSNGARE
ncbi:Mg-dependent DNase [Exophiala viscosa]|uniref:Mg-dependent DNase n=1 Tax=Exophiala viscosa TaxID=2486360 RepID=A0AAN6E4H6_9EURO|nr:Mg-dependent DNase [Exophiala viscosa]KAI1626953.1 Mg-dependent DNase [Exophiala viscosa]